MKTPIQAYRQRKAEREQLKRDKELAKEQAKSRKPEEIQADYNKLVGQAGEKQYRIEIMKEELVQINQLLFRLNNEFNKSRELYKDSQTPKPQVQEKDPDIQKQEVSH